MKKNEQFKRIVLFFLSVFIIFIQSVVFWKIWIDCYNPYIERSLFRRGHWVMILIYVLLLFGFSKLYGAYKVGYLRTMDIIFSQILSLIFVNVIMYLQICLLSLKLVSAVPITKMTLVQVVNIGLWALLSKVIYSKLYPPRRMLMVFGDRDPDELVDKMGRRTDKYNICGYIHINKGLKAVEEKIPNYEAVILCDLPDEIRNTLVKYCFQVSVRTYVTPKISDVILMGADSMHLFDTPLLLSRNAGLKFEQRFAKRMMDLLISIPMFIILSPFMLISAVCIKLYDGGPVLYKQERLTLDKKVFYIYKFRSMRVDSEENGARLAKKHDDRVTPIGKILRISHFDEIPQLFNIIKGEMSLVGPRPERPSIAEEYEKELPEFGFRLKAKAGLTGYAQIYGKYSTTPYDKLKLDLYYIEHQTILLDLRLLLMTVKIIFQKENAEGVKSGQVTALTSKKTDE